MADSKTLLGAKILLSLSPKNRIKPIMVFTNLNLHQIELFCFRKLSQNSRLVFTFPNSFGRSIDFFFSRMSSMTKLAKKLFFPPTGR